MKDFIEKKTNLICYITNHFTQNIHESFKEVRWGQTIGEFPQESLKKIFSEEEIENLDHSNYLTVENIAKFNIELQNFISQATGERPNLKMYNYDFSGLSISQPVQSEMVEISVTFQKEKEKHLYKKKTTTIIDCRRCPRMNRAPSLSSFPTIEDFFKTDPHQTPVIIDGSGPSGMWLAEICRQKKIPFQFLGKLDLNKLPTNKRNEKMVKYIQRNWDKIQFIGVPVIFSSLDLQAREQAEEYMNCNEAKCKFSQHEKLSLAYCTEEDSGEYFVARLIQCIGYDDTFQVRNISDLKYDYLTTPIERINCPAVDQKARKEDIGPDGLKGSFMHQFIDGCLLIEKYLKLETHKNSGIHILFITKKWKSILSVYFGGKGVEYIDDTFFEILYESVSKNCITIPKNDSEAIDIYTNSFSERLNGVPDLQTEKLNTLKKEFGEIVSTLIKSKQIPVVNLST